MSDFSERDIEFHRLTAGEYDDETTRVYGIYHRHSLYPYLDRLVSAGDVRKALDMGCGTGVVTMAMASRGLEVTGVDHSPDMLAAARSNAARLPTGAQPRLQVGDITHLAFADNEFDLVICQGVLHHLAEIEPTLAEMNRLLRPGGSFYISEPCIGNTPAGQAAAISLTALRRIRKPAGARPESVEAPIEPLRLTRGLDRLGLDYRVEYLTHLPGVERVLRDRARLAVTRFVSAPWRWRRGNLVFVEGGKPSSGSAHAAVGPMTGSCA